MRISDWSSDVCSSDLSGRAFGAASSPPRGRAGRRAARRRSAARAHRPTRLRGADDRAHIFAARRKSGRRSEEHTSELQSLMRISYAVFCLKKKKKINYILQNSYIQTHTTPIKHSNLT